MGACAEWLLPSGKRTEIYVSQPKIDDIIRFRDLMERLATPAASPAYRIRLTPQRTGA